MPALYLLQLKPLIRSEGKAAVDVEGLDRGRAASSTPTAAWATAATRACRTSSGWTRGASTARPTVAIASEIEELDKEMRALGRRYVLVGPGRWGTRDRWLGVPVAFTQISMARVIVEADLPEFKVESSLGSHFFHNVTSMNIGYFTVPWNGEGSVDWDWLYSIPPARSTAHCSRTFLREHLEILMDGRRSVAAIRKRCSPPDPVSH